MLTRRRGSLAVRVSAVPIRSIRQELGRTGSNPVWQRGTEVIVHHRPLSFEFLLIKSSLLLHVEFVSREEPDRSRIKQGRGVPKCVLNQDQSSLPGIAWISPYLLLLTWRNDEFVSLPPLPIYHGLVLLLISSGPKGFVSPPTEERIESSARVRRSSDSLKREIQPRI